MCDCRNAADEDRSLPNTACDETTETCPPEEEIRVFFVTPGNDPVNSPDATVGSDSQNEFTYSTANPGILTIQLRARVEPSGRAAEAQARVRFEVEAVGGSTLSWEGDAGGSPTSVNGDFLETVATFTGLPANNSEFGLKTARLFLDNGEVDTRTYEVFFPRDATNHPGGNSAAPNWFHYWEQVAGVSNVVYGGSSGSSAMAGVRGMTDWSYTAAPDKTHLYMYDEVVTKARSYGVGVEVSGIDNFVASAHHEGKHTDQIAAADALVPGVRCWQYGYSWNTTHNHYGPGPDGKWGPAPGTETNSVAVSPPFEPGGGDDVDIDHPSHRHWPNTWPLPTPSWASIHPIEDEAVMYADAQVPSDHDNADQDWGDPGKNHQTLLKYDD